MIRHQAIPVVMAFAGSDPTGGAGIQADIETLASMGCHTAPIVTAVTVQDTRDVKTYTPLDAALVTAQARAVLEDMPVTAIKIGMLGSAEIAAALHSLLADHPDIPVVLDPVLASGAGTALADAAVREAVLSLLLPLTTVLTPNSLEARALVPHAGTLEACAMALLARGCEFVLITGAHENSAEVVNTLYGDQQRLETFRWKRLPGGFHGSGCTLAAAIAGLLAQALEPLAAIHQAQEYTWETLNQAYRIGKGQFLPNRLFWARKDDARR